MLIPRVSDHLPNFGMDTSNLRGLEVNVLKNKNTQSIDAFCLVLPNARKDELLLEYEAVVRSLRSSHESF